MTERRERSGLEARSWKLHASVCVSVEEPFDDGEPHDLEVEAHRPVLDVIEVVLDALLERRVTTPAVDLGPPGQAGFHLVAQHVLRDAMLELLDEMRALGTGTDNRHVAAEHVP